MLYHRFVLLAVIGMFCSLAGCGNGEGDNFEEQTERNISIGAFANGTEFSRINMPAPVDLEVCVFVSCAPSLKDAAGGLAQLADRVELRLQKDLEWIDVTSLYKQYWSDSAIFVNSKFSHNFQRTISTPGSYSVDARVTFFDGVVLETGTFERRELAVTE